MQSFVVNVYIISFGGVFVKRAEKYALARLLIKWGYYGNFDQQTFLDSYADIQHIIVVFINELLSCIQVSRSDLDVIAEKILEVSKNE